MKTFNNEIHVHKGEAFCIDKLIENKDGSPYIISNQLSNPYFVISVSTTRYTQQNRYIKQYWLSLANFPRFYSTKAINIRELYMSNEEGATPCNSFDDIILNTTETSSDGKLYVIEAYLNGKYTMFLRDDAVFYLEDEDGNVEYKYINENYEWSKYECRITKTFAAQDTDEWVEQSYVYDIRLLSGDDTLTYLQNYCKENGIEYNENYDLTSMQELLKDYTFDVNISNPIVNIIVNTTILSPTKLSVLSTIKGGF